MIDSDRMCTIDQAQVFSGVGVSSAFGAVPQPASGPPQPVRSYATGAVISAAPAASPTKQASTVAPADQMLRDGLNKRVSFPVIRARGDAAMRFSGVVRDVIRDLQMFNLGIGVDGLQGHSPNFTLSMTTQHIKTAPGQVTSPLQGVPRKLVGSHLQTGTSIFRAARIRFSFVTGGIESPLYARGVVYDPLELAREELLPEWKSRKVRENRYFGMIICASQSGPERRAILRIFLQDAATAFAQRNSLTGVAFRPTRLYARAAARNPEIQA